MAPFLIFILASLLNAATSASLGNNTDPTLTITAKPSYGCSTICQAFGAPDRCSLEMETRRMSEELSKVMLDKHNQLRRKLAKGEEENWPSAANMRKLVWSEELASSAQEQAEQCNPDGTFDVPRAEFVGIRMLSDPGSNWTMTMDDFEKIVQNWYASKVDSFDFEDFPNFGGTGISAGDATFSANTKALGCGLVIHSSQERTGGCLNSPVSTTAQIQSTRRGLLVPLASLASRVTMVSVRQAILRLRQLKVEALRVGALQAEALRVAALKEKALKVEALKVEALRVEALRVEALRVAALKVEALKVEALRVAALKEKALVL